MSPVVVFRSAYRGFVGQPPGESSRLWMSFCIAVYVAFAAAFGADVIFVFGADLACKCALFDYFMLDYLEYILYNVRVSECSVRRLERATKCFNNFSVRVSAKKFRSISPAL